MTDQVEPYSIRFSNQVNRIVSFQGLIRRIDNSGPNNAPLFIGLAKPGTAENAPGWQIRKFTFDINNLTDGENFANGSVEFNAIWTDRAALSYS